MRARKLPKWFAEYVPEEVADSSLFKFTVAIGDKRVSVDMCVDLEVDYQILQQQLEDTPSEFAYWAAIFSELKMQVNKVERQIKVRRGKLVSRIVKEAMDAGMRVTDKQVQSIIDADEELVKLEAKLMLLQKHTGKMGFMIDAIRMKSDNLRSLAGFARIEMQNTTN